MKIRHLGFENFRCFKARGDVFFETDGRVNMIYGVNGAGKTTLHQLIQWIFYNAVDFNKSDSGIMYNHDYELEQPINSIFSVIGEVEFEHDGKIYRLRREWEYQRKTTKSVNINKKATLSYKTDDYEWPRVPGDSKDFIEKILPSGLSAYFFFDGERMITDLMEKGQDSSKKLKKTLYSIFNLNLYENASRHIGMKDSNTSVMGKLYKSKTSEANKHEIDALKANIENAIGQIEEVEANISTREDIQQQILNEIREISEKIGSAKTNKEYEKIRKVLKSNADSLIKQIESEQLLFGERLVQHYPQKLAFKSVLLAKKMAKSKLDNEVLIPGIEKPLIEALLNGDGTCICGQNIDDNARTHLEHYIDLLPPASYKRVYDTFTSEAEKVATSENYRLDQHIKNVLDLRRDLHNTENQIKSIDDEKKAVSESGIEKLIIKRRELEEDNKINEDELKKLRERLSKLKMYLNKKAKDYDSKTENNSNNAIVNLKMEIMKEVKQHFDDKLLQLASDYSKKLCDNIRDLLATMLTTKRFVQMSDDFLLRVYDNHGDEYKSEGQFATVTFAYIGGIFRIINEDLNLPNKEFPLVVDGPFSKLDIENRQNVINCLPEYAPQLILFSKDELNHLFRPEKIGKVYNIVCNEYKNVATIEEV